MKTPRSRTSADVLLVTPPKTRTFIDPASGVSRLEARAIVRTISPVFTQYAEQYDTGKYWPEVYKRAVSQFRRPGMVEPEMLRDAILWKYGHCVIRPILITESGRT